MLVRGQIKLSGCPDLSDVRSMSRVLESFGCKAAREGRELIALATQMGLHLQLCQQLIPKPGKEVNRFLLLFSREIAKPTWLESVICTENGEYHESYCQMVAPFYLKL